MSNVRSVGVIALGLLGAIVVCGVAHVAAQAGPQLPISTNVAAVPSRDDMSLAPLPLAEVAISSSAAVSAAMTEWDLSASQLDESVGVVPAVVTESQSVTVTPAQRTAKALLVVANITTHSPVPFSSTTYSKMVIVVDAQTGRVRWSYPVEPSGGE